MVAARVRPFAALLAAVVLVAVPATAQAQDPVRIAAGVSAGGVDLSGLTVAEATARLNSELRPRLARDVVVRVAGKRFALGGATLKARFSAAGAAKQALAIPASPAGAHNGGASYGSQIEIKVAHAHLPVAAFAAHVAAAVARPAQDATLTIGLRRLHVRRARLGIAVDAAALAKRIDVLADEADAPRAISIRVQHTRPQVNADDLRIIHNTVITIDKAHFKLRLFKGLKFRKAYDVAIGQPAYPTPVGHFMIQDKQVNPVWSVPNSPWAGELGGSTVAGGSAGNPLKARWMGITNGVGIHGTGEPWSVGSAASHGCLRMRVPDVIDLFPRVPVGTAVLIR